jgi:hypothetical protein
VTVEASETAIFVADKDRNALIGCDFRADIRDAVAAFATLARPAPLRGAAFRLDLEATLAGRLVLTERLFMEQL